MITEFYLGVIQKIRYPLRNAQKIAYKSLACKARITVISCFLSVP